MTHCLDLHHRRYQRIHDPDEPSEQYYNSDVNSDIDNFDEFESRIDFFHSPNGNECLATATNGVVNEVILKIVVERDVFRSPEECLKLKYAPVELSFDLSVNP